VKLKNSRYLKHARENKNFFQRQQIGKQVSVWNSGNWRKPGFEIVMAIVYCIYKLSPPQPSIPSCQNLRRGWKTGQEVYSIRKGLCTCKNQNMETKKFTSWIINRTQQFSVESLKTSYSMRNYQLINHCIILYGDCIKMTFIMYMYGKAECYVVISKKEEGSNLNTHLH